MATDAEMSLRNYRLMLHAKTGMKDVLHDNLEPISALWLSRDALRAKLAEMTNVKEFECLISDCFVRARMKKTRYVGSIPCTPAPVSEQAQIPSEVGWITNLTIEYQPHIY